MENILGGKPETNFSYFSPKIRACQKSFHHVIFHLYTFHRISNKIIFQNVDQRDAVWDFPGDFIDFMLHLLFKETIIGIFKPYDN